jgi:hypothetical protein
MADAETRELSAALLRREVVAFARCRYELAHVLFCTHRSALLLTPQNCSRFTGLIGG